MCAENQPKAGLLFLGCDRFRSLGAETDEGPYSERCISVISGIEKAMSSLAEVVNSGAVYDRNDVNEAMSLFLKEKVDMVIVIFLSWTPDRCWNQFLRDFPTTIPVVYTHITREVCLHDTHDDSEFVKFLMNAGLVGSLECSGDTARYNRPMLFTVAGSWEDVQKQLLTIGKAALLRRRLRDAHFGIMDSYNEVMWSTYVDPYSLFMKVGPELHFLSVAEWDRIINDYPVDIVDQKVSMLQEKYEVLPGVDIEKLKASVRATLAMESMAQNYGLDVLVYNDVETNMLKTIGLRPGFYPLLDAEKRCLIVPEGDIGSGIALLVLATFGNGFVNYMEPFYYDKERDAIIAGHAGPNDYTDPKGIMKISRDVRFEKTSYRYAGAPFAWYVFPEGRKTLLHCSQKNGRFQFVVTMAEFLPCEHFLATYCHGAFRPENISCVDFLTELMKIGVTQHYLSADGDYRKEIKALAEMLDFDYIEL